MYSFSGKLIDGIESYQWLIDSIPRMEGCALICSAFLKKGILEEFRALVPAGKSVKVLSRWQLGDLVVGASDISAYELCKNFGWDLHIKLNFHGKVFCIPKAGILVGSANATSSGFGLRPNSNSEVGTIVNLTSENISLVEGLFSDSIKINDEIYQELKKIVDAHEGQRNKTIWPQNILNLIEKADHSLERFFISECLQSSGADIFLGRNLKDIEIISDLSLLCLLSGEISQKNIQQAFINTKVFKWCYATTKKNGGTLSFGGLTAALHNSLYENPAPYRVEVKRLVKNLFSWIALVGSEEAGLAIFQPNHTQILRII